MPVGGFAQVRNPSAPILSSRTIFCQEFEARHNPQTVLYDFTFW
jgi:hypothetical protein